MKRISRREMIAGMGLAAGAGVLATTTGCTRARAAATETQPLRPNIIFVLADDLGYGDLGCFGQKEVKTPCLDAMAAEGVLFTQAYAGSTVCAPSRCSLMTGLHTGHCQIRGNKLVPLRPEDTTVAEVLKSAGYTTGLVGKWGLGEPGTTGVPNRKGFDYFFGYLNQRNAHNYYPEYLWKNEEKYPLEGNKESTEKVGVSVERTQYTHDLFTSEALSFIERGKDNPFFLYLAYTMPHANNERGAAEGDGMEVPDYGDYADKPWPSPQKGHAAMISRMDRDIGKLFEKLRALGIDDNTLVIFSSDNGTHKEGGADPDFFKSSGPLRGYKRALYDGGIRVPTIARWPGKVAPGTRNEHPWAFWDFLPTAAELAGADCPKGLDGISVVPAFLGETSAARPQPAHDFMYWEFHEGGTSQAVRMGDWKAVRNKQGAPLELYDIAKDPGEKDDVAAEHPDVVKRVEDYLARARTESAEWPIQHPPRKKTE